MQQLSQWLETHIPPCDSDAGVTRISHGDYRSASQQNQMFELLLYGSDGAQVIITSQQLWKVFQAIPAAIGHLHRARICRPIVYLLIVQTCQL